jgi:nucleoside-diphosphate-sugar epimerase
MIKKRILIVGGEGYIGSYLCNNLQYQYDILSIDLGWFTPDSWRASSRRPSAKKVTFVHGRITTDLILPIESFDAIIWVAGHSSVKMCENDFNSAYENNVVEFTGFLDEYINTYRDRRPLLIFTSSSSVYGNVDRMAIETEVDDGNIRGPYDQTMRLREIDANKTMKNGCNKIIGLRLGTVCGFSPNQREELMLNSMVHSGLTEGKIYYSNPDTKRAILDLDDLSDIIDTILDKYFDDEYQATIDDGNFAGLYNTSSYNSTVGELAEICLDTMRNRGFKVELVESDAPASPYSFHLDRSLFRKRLGFINNSITPKNTINTIIDGYLNKPSYYNFGDRNEPRHFRY